jgi:hypothetical protein
MQFHSLTVHGMASETLKEEVYKECDTEMKD